jgi:hypothetical protein
VQSTTPGRGGGRPTDRVDHNGPGNEGAERRRFLMSDLGGEVDVQQVAFITLVIMIVLPGRDRTYRSRK